MKNKLLAILIYLLTVSLLSVSMVPASADSTDNTIDRAYTLADGIVDYNLRETGSSSVQGWINGSLTQNAGYTSEWYVLSLSQKGNYSFSSYESALKSYLKNNEVYSASSRLKYALALIAVGSSDSYIADVMENSIGQQGVMSWVYGLHLLNNGYKSNSHTISSVKQKLLSLQLRDGGWAVTGSTGDVDVTAMAVHALAPYYKSDSSVNSAVNSALSLLSSRQLSDGDYSSYGVPNPESTAQVIVALSALGIDFSSDSRFIKNGNNLLNGISKYRLSDGSFCHKAGTSSNSTATAQVYCAMVSYMRMCSGKSSLYILDKRNPSALIVTKPTEASTNNQTDKNTATDTYEVKTTVNSPENETAQPQSQAEENTRVAASDTATVSTQATVTSSSNEENNSLSATADSADVDSNRGGYKLWVCLGIAGVAGAVCLVLFITKKRNKKNFIAVLIVTVLAICFVVFTNFQTTDEYYNGTGTEKNSAVGEVTLTIRCNTVADKSDSDYIPADGVILDTTEFVIEENDTVYKVLVDAARKYNIQIESSGSEGMAYISGINYLYEFDFGDLSGWMYYVNGEASSVGCDSYVLSDGDTIEWLYTCDLGNDLK